MHVSDVRFNHQREVRSYILQGLGFRIEGMRAETIRSSNKLYLSDLGDAHNFNCGDVHSFIPGDVRKQTLTSKRM